MRSNLKTIPEFDSCDGGRYHRGCLRAEDRADSGSEKCFFQTEALRPADCFWLEISGPVNGERCRTGGSFLADRPYQIASENSIWSMNRRIRGHRTGEIGP